MIIICVKAHIQEMLIFGLIKSRLYSMSEYYRVISCLVGQPGSSVGIATGYGLDDPVIESRWGRDISHLSRPALGSTQPPVQWVPGLSKG